MPCTEELKGEGCVGHDSATLLPYRLVDDSGALDVASLSFADSEDLGDALDAVYVARCVVLWLSACEGFLYGFVDYLCELCYGEVDDSGVLIYHILFCLCLAAGERLERPSSSCRVSGFAVEGLYLLSYPARWGGLLAFLPWLMYGIIQRITAVFDSV